MATATLTRKQRTPYSLVYEMGGGDGALTNFDGSVFINDLANGPLKALLRKLYVASKMDTLNLDGANSKYVRIRHVEGIAATQTTAATRTVVWTTTGLHITATAASTSEIEIRLAHSVER
jgi:hypothetical protein